MTIAAPAKINLGLHVLRRRGDGYHDIETVMLRIGWSDAIEIEPADEIRVTASRADLPVGPENLCFKAARALADRYGVDAGAHLHLTKRIPVGAGLGGGSSDAAATLRGLSRLWGLPVDDGDLAQIGATVGSDVPFFLGPSPALAEGRGEQLSAVTSADGSALTLPFTFVVVKPEPSVSTAEAYRWVHPSERDRADLPEVVQSCDLARWRTELTNDFESAVAARLSVVDRLKVFLYEAGAGFACMSGSGTAVFGVFEEKEAARKSFRTAEEMGYACWLGSTD